MPAIQTTDSSPDVICHLFNLLEKQGVKSSVELKFHNSFPLLFVGKALVKAVLVAQEDKPYLEVTDGNVVFNFNLEQHRFSICYINNHLYIAITGDSYTAWFNSDGLSKKALHEIRNMCMEVIN